MSRRRLVLLQMLLLLDVLLRELLCLLLVLLFYLLFSRVVGFLLIQSLVLLILPLLEILAFFVLLRLELVLLLLVFLVFVWVSSVRGRRAFATRNVVGMDHVVRTSRVVVFRTRVRRFMKGAAFAGRNYGAAAQFSRPLGGGNGRLAVVGRGAKLRIAAGRFEMLSLC